MTRRHLLSVAAVAATLALALTACTPSTTASVTPTPITTPSSPAPSPTPTYGPNQTAALATVTAYYAWWNTARKNPLDPKFSELEKVTTSSAYTKITPHPLGDISDLGSFGNRQVGDMVVTQMVPTADNAARIPVTLCLDRTGTKVVNASGATVDPIDANTGATIPASQAFTRSSYFAVVTSFPDGRWLITEIAGGKTSC